jgi:hypothetical protein
VPGLRLSDRLFEPPENVGVAPTTAPEADATVTLCSKGDAFVNAIETWPALAVSEVVSNFNWPSALAARLSVCAAPLVAGAGVEEVAELDAAGVGAELVAEEAEEVVVLDELPQPANALRPATSASTETVEKNCDFARAAVVNLKVRSSVGWGRRQEGHCPPEILPIRLGRRALDLG